MDNVMLIESPGTEITAGAIVQACIWKIDDKYPYEVFGIVKKLDDDRAVVDFEDGTTHTVPIDQLMPYLDLSTIAVGQWDFNLRGMISHLVSIAFYNGWDEEIYEWRNLPVGEYGSIHCPLTAKDSGSQLQIFWMMFVLLFGDYGTSPRFGWIEPKFVDDFRKMCCLFKEFDYEG